jgi:translocator protein
MLLSLAVALALPLGIGFSSASPKAPEVYASLKKPSWSPPARLFGPVWTSLYCMLGAASWVVWREVGMSGPALVAYAANLALNAAWSPVFFGLGTPSAALPVAVGLAVSSMHLVPVFGEVSSLAAWLVLPNAAWTCFAAALNASIVCMNPSR